MDKTIKNIVFQINTIVLGCIFRFIDKFHGGMSRESATHQRLSVLHVSQGTVYAHARGVIEAAPWVPAA